MELVINACGVALLTAVATQYKVTEYFREEGEQRKAH